MLLQCAQVVTDDILSGRSAMLVAQAELRKIAKRVAMRFNTQGLWTACRLVTMVLWVAYMAHIIACGWFFLGTCLDAKKKTAQRTHFQTQGAWTGADHDRLRMTLVNWSVWLWIHVCLDCVQGMASKCSTTG